MVSLLFKTGIIILMIIVKVVVVVGVRMDNKKNVLLKWIRSLSLQSGKVKAEAGKFDNIRSITKNYVEVLVSTPKHASIPQTASPSYYL